MWKVIDIEIQEALKPQVRKIETNPHNQTVKRQRQGLNFGSSKSDSSYTGSVNNNLNKIIRVVLSQKLAGEKGVGCNAEKIKKSIENYISSKTVF